MKNTTTYLWLLCRRATKLNWPKPDQAGSVVVRASSSRRARTLASQGVASRHAAGVWLDPVCTSCQRLSNDGREEVLLDVSIRQP